MDENAPRAQPAVSAAEKSPVTYGEEIAQGLGCQVGRAHVAIPLAAVRHVVEFEVASLAPLTHRFIGGVGFHAGRAVVSVLLAPEGDGAPAGPARRRVKAVLLGEPGDGVDWALEVDRVGGLVRARVAVERANERSNKLPVWVTRARDADGRRLAWLDVDVMIRELSGVTRRLRA